MGVGAGLSMYVVVVQKFTFAISSPDEFLSVCPVLSCLSVTLVYCGQTAGWIKMALGTEVGLGPVHIVLDGDTTPLPKTAGRAPPPNFPPIFIVAKRLDASRCHLVRM